jgi:hypothetical protein
MQWVAGTRRGFQSLLVRSAHLARAHDRGVGLATGDERARVGRRTPVRRSSHGAGVLGLPAEGVIVPSAPAQRGGGGCPGDGGCGGATNDCNSSTITPTATSTSATLKVGQLPPQG